MRLPLIALALCLSLGCGATRVTQVGRSDAVRETRAAMAVAVYPPIALADRPVQITWRIEPDPDNREWEIRFEYRDDRSLSARTFGETSFRRIQQQSVTGIPEGRYEVTLIVRRADGRERRISTPLCMKGMDVTCTEDFHDGTAGTAGVDPF